MMQLLFPPNVLWRKGSTGHGGCVWFSRVFMAVEEGACLEEVR